MASRDPDWLYVLAALLVCGALGCSGCGRPPPALHFTDVTAGSGIDLENVSGSAQKLRITETLGQGAAALDYDGDGRLDLFVVNGDVFEGTPLRAEPRPALYRNLGGWRFTDVTARAGLLFRAWSHGATRVDFDADGWPDLYVTVNSGPNRFFRNRGDGTFEDASARWGGADPGPSTAAVFFDADADGDLDLYVGNYVAEDPRHPPRGGKLCEWRGLQVMCGPAGLPPSADAFYENRGGTLIAATAAFGFANVKPCYALGAVSGDFDDDGDPDLYVANDSEPNYLFENLGAGRFHENASRRGVDRNQDGRAQASMGVDAGDVDNDGHLDLFVTTFSHDANTLYRSRLTPRRELLFEDATYVAGLGLPSYSDLSWGTRILDLDLDGWQDIVVASGHVYPQVDGAATGTTYAQPNSVYHNRGATAAGFVRFERFEPGPRDAFHKSSCSRGLVAADLDDDGDTDLLFVELDAAPTLVRNDSTGLGHWIGFLLRDRGANRDAIGARLAVVDGTGVRRWRELSGGGSYLSSGDPRVVVGLGAAAGPVRRVEVRWPGGRTTVHEGLDIDRYWLLDASSASARPLGRPPDESP